MLAKDLKRWLDYIDDEEDIYVRINPIKINFSDYLLTTNYISLSSVFIDRNEERDNVITIEVDSELNT